MNGPTANIPAPQIATLLLVDDEPNILSALRRLFRTEHKVLTAESGAAGLAILEKESVDLVISDMRMPEMTGAEFLGEVARRWPTVVRLLLTGYADLGATIEAINRGAIYRYVSKPWGDDDLRLTVRQALEHRHLRQERERLLLLVARQNRELKEMNAGLEAKVAARTEEIRQTAGMLDVAYQEMKRGYFEAIPVFARLMEMREGDAGWHGHGRRVGEMARGVAAAMHLEDDAARDVYFAGLLHDLGKISLPDHVLRKPEVALTSEERALAMRHPVTGQAALMALEPLQGAATLIRHHHERFDGAGYPDRLEGDAIPLGARVLAVVNDYDALQTGTMLDGQVSPAEARAFVAQNTGTRYDPHVVTSFMQWLDASPLHGRVVTDLRMTSADLETGMTLTQDLMTSDGILLLAKGSVLNGRMVEHIRRFEQEEQRHFTIHVRRG